MAHRIILIIDSATGAMVDVAGNSRETGRYSKFSRRMLSLHTNPHLDYGVNGGDTLIISKNGLPGKLINLIADKVNVSGELLVGGKTIEEIIAGGGTISILDSVVGTDKQIDVDTVVDETSGKLVRQISLDPVIITKMEQVFSLVDRFEEEFESVNSEIGLLQGRASTLESGLSGTNDRVKSLEDEFEESDGRVVKLEDEFGDNGRVTKLEDEFGEDGRVTKLEDEFGENGRVTKLETGLEEVDERVKAIEDEFEDPEGKVVELESDVSTLKSDVTSLEESMSQYISKDDLATAIDGIEIYEEDTFEDVKSKLKTLLENLAELTSSPVGEEEEP